MPGVSPPLSLIGLLACAGPAPSAHSADTGLGPSAPTGSTSAGHIGGSGAVGGGDTGAGPTDDGSLVGAWAGKATMPGVGYPIPHGSGHYDAFVRCDGWVHLVVDPDPTVPVTGSMRCDRFGAPDRLTGASVSPTQVTGTVSEEGLCDAPFVVERVGLERPVFRWTSCLSPRIEVSAELFPTDGAPTSAGSGGWTDRVPGGSGTR